jgi:hypothetical protein
MPTRSGRLLRVVATAALVLVLAGCGDTLQLQPLRDRDLSNASGVNYIVYWDGRAFEGMPVSFAARQTGGSVLVTYGNCVEGGQTTCMRALSIVTSDDNSFLPGAQLTSTRRIIRGRVAVVGMGGRTLEIATGPVVVDVTASTPALTLAAALAMSPLNGSSSHRGAPYATLPPALPPNGFDQTAS